MPQPLTPSAARAGLGRAGPGGAAARGRALSIAWACLVVVLPPLVVVWPWLLDGSTYGFHDWDVMASHRYLAVESLRRFRELPAYNPYACGGFPAWGYVEGGTIVVSPWLPLYLGLDLRWAIRAEVLGMALVGAAGSYALAGRYARSLAARGLVVALFAVNGRFGLQAAAGHAWHLAYAWLPWCWYFLDRALADDARPRDPLLAAAAFATLVYAGGIYPLPHAVIVALLVASTRALGRRSSAPLAALAGVGALAIAWSAPKLVPMLATFRRAPRLVDSTETLSLEAFVRLLTSRAQGFFDRPAEVSPYGWHEWGMYVSPLGAGLFAAGLVACVVRRRGRDVELVVVAAALLVLGFGAFHRLAPWSLLHEHVPFFRSLHVPSRFLYPAALACALAAARLVDRLVGSLGARLRAPRGVEAAAALATLALALDVASIAQLPMRDAMRLRAPERIERAPSFAHARRAPVQYVVPDWAAPLYLAMRANRGVLECYGAPPFDGVGALAVDDSRYRGEVEVRDASGLAPRATARVVDWSFSRATVEVSGAPLGARLVYNMNADPGWTARVDAAGGSRAVEVGSHRDRVALAIPEGASTVRLAYVPPGLGLGCGIGVLGIVVAFAWRRVRGAPEAA